MYSWPKASETTMDKMDAIDRFHSATNKEHLSRFLTMIEYQPLTYLLLKFSRYIWSEDRLRAVETMNHILLSVPF